MLFTGQQIHVVLVERYTQSDDVTEQVLVAGNLLQHLLQVVADFVLRGQEHGEILRFLKRLRVGHDLEKLGGSVIYTK